MMGWAGLIVISHGVRVRCEQWWKAFIAADQTGPSLKEYQSRGRTTMQTATSAPHMPRWSLDQCWDQCRFIALLLAPGQHSCCSSRPTQHARSGMVSNVRKVRRSVRSASESEARNASVLNTMTRSTPSALPSAFRSVASSELVVAMPTAPNRLGRMREVDCAPNRSFTITHTKRFW